VVIMVEIRDRISNQSGASSTAPPGASQSELKREYPRSTRTHAASMTICRWVSKKEHGVGRKTDESDDELVNVSGF
jgi:hypothetical protein